MSNANLIALIDQMVLDKTIGLDAIDRVKDLKDRATAQLQQIDSLQKSVDSYKVDATSQRERIGALQNQVAAFEKREADLVERERKIFEHEKNAAVANGQIAAYREVAALVFRNTGIREHVLSNDPQWVAGMNGCGPQLMHTQTSKTFERTAD